jgi:3-phosphoshikimate 1-carboxyvinyltransferase
VTVQCDPPGREARRFRVPAGSVCRATDFTVEGDWSSASYFFAAAAITGGGVTVTGIDPDSAQGDARFLGLLERMGCTVERGDNAVTVRGVPPAGKPGPVGPTPGGVRGIDADCADMPDIVPTLAVVALFAAGPTRISGVPHLRIKETDRIAALVAEIRRLAAKRQKPATV